MLAAALPACSQICRVKEATDVLPLVPVTATIVSGCLPKKRAARQRQRQPRIVDCDHRHRGSRPAWRRLPATIAAAPRLTASAA